MKLEIRRLAEQDAEAMYTLRLHGLESVPAAFAEDAEEHRRSSIQQFADRLRTGGNYSMVFGAFDGPRLIGLIGIYRELRIKRRHKAGIWGMFVHEEYRGKGAGRALLGQAIEAARTMPGVRSIFLSVSETQPAARALYVSAGFRPYGMEPEALKVGDQYLAEEFLTLTL